MEKLTIRQKLIGCRKMLNMSQEDMAQLLDMHRITYFKKEKNPETFTVEETKKIQEYFDKKIENAPKIFI